MKTIEDHTLDALLTTEKLLWTIANSQSEQLVKILFGFSIFDFIVLIINPVAV